MKKNYLTLFGLFFSLLGFSNSVIILDGNYQGKNLYIDNPFGPNKVGFCVTEVKVNGNVTTDEIGSSSFEIDFKAQQLKIGDKVEVKITHKDDCKPKVVNPEVLKPRSTFECTSISVDNNMLLKWTSKNESGKLTYVVEQYRWNKWVKVGEVEGVGSAAANDYSFKVTPHTGKNQFRVKQVDYSGSSRISKSTDYVSSAPEITYSPSDKVTKEINFSAATKPAETMFEIYDQYGNIVKRGFASKVDVANLPKGSYYLDYDNKMAEFVKK